MSDPIEIASLDKGNGSSRKNPTKSSSCNTAKHVRSTISSASLACSFEPRISSMCRNYCSFGSSFAPSTAKSLKRIPCAITTGVWTNASYPNCRSNRLRLICCKPTWNGFANSTRWTGRWPWNCRPIMVVDSTASRFRRQAAFEETKVSWTAREAHPQQWVEICRILTPTWLQDLIS